MLERERESRVNPALALSLSLSLSLSSSLPIFLLGPEIKHSATGKQAVSRETRGQLGIIRVRQWHCIDDAECSTDFTCGEECRFYFEGCNELGFKFHLRPIVGNALVTAGLKGHCPLVILVTLTTKRFIEALRNENTHISCWLLVSYDESREYLARTVA